MKNKSTIFLSLVMLFSAVGCNDYLEEVNNSNVVAEEFYTTQEGYESLVNATYATLRDVYGSEPWIFSAGTDLFVEGRNQQPEGISEYRNLGPAEGAVEDFYLNVYAAIRQANTALYYNDITEETALLEQRKGEIKFLRAYYYFLLVQQFGDVALVTDFLNEVVTEFERRPASEVYQFIISEMEEALELVPENAESRGRVDKAAVYHFLAKAHLTRGYESYAAADDFQKAAAYADEAISRGSLVNSFGELFFPGNENNEEVLFAVQYSSSSIVDPREDGHMQNLFFGPYLGGEGAVQGYPYRSNTLVPTMFLFNAFSEHDARFEATFMVEVYDRYYDYYDRNGELDALVVETYFAPRWAVQDTAAWRAVNPETRAAARIRPYPIGWEAGANSLDGTSPGIKKFDDPKSAFSNNGSSTRDIILARLGETYLIAAEAYLQMGQPGTAAERINAVRLRAAKPGSEAQMSITADVVDIDFILNERARELAGEYHRWFDLKRTGELVERTRLYNRDIRTWFESGINPFEGTDGNLKILRPIPQLAIDLNEADVQQNPGY
jgi:hypothetical protein